MTSFFPISEEPINALASGQDFNAGLVTFYFSQDGFFSDASATVSSTFFAPRLRQSFRHEMSIVNRDGLAGRIRDRGEITLLNSDGGLDNLIRAHAIDGRSIIIRAGASTFRYDDFSTVFSGTAEEWNYNRNFITIPITDKTFQLDINIQTNTYTSAQSVDLAGKPKPICFGEVFNIEPPLISAASLIYQMADHSIASVLNVYDQGVALSATVNTPSAGEYVVNTSAGTFTLGALPAGKITCDLQGYNVSAYVNKTGDIARTIIVDYAGFSANAIDVDSFASVNIDQPGEIGIWVPAEEVFISDVLDEILQGASAYYGFRRNGKIMAGILAAPTNNPIYTINEFEIIEIERIAMPNTISPPNWRRRVGYKKNYTIQTEDLAGSVTAARRQFLAQERRLEDDSDGSIQSKHLQATDPPAVESLFIQASAAKAEATRLLTLYKEDRNIYRITLKTKLFQLLINDTIRVVFPRWGLNEGKNMRVVGISEDTSQRVMELDVFG